MCVACIRRSSSERYSEIKDFWSRFLSLRCEALFGVDPSKSGKKAGKRSLFSRSGVAAPLFRERGADKRRQGFPTVHRAGATPVPIPNTEVKPRFGDGTAHFLCGRVARRWDFMRTALEETTNRSASGAVSILESAVCGMEFARVARHSHALLSHVSARAQARRARAREVYPWLVQESG